MYCTCELPIKMIRNTSESYKFWRCVKCGEKVDPASKMVNKNIDKLTLLDPTRNELLLEQKLNEVIDLIKCTIGGN
jgi:hypothetical protein